MNFFDKLYLLKVAAGPLQSRHPNPPGWDSVTTPSINGRKTMGAPIGTPGLTGGFNPGKFSPGKAQGFLAANGEGMDFGSQRQKDVYNSYRERFGKGSAPVGGGKPAAGGNAPTAGGNAGGSSSHKKTPQKPSADISKFYKEDKNKNLPQTNKQYDLSGYGKKAPAAPAKDGADMSGFFQPKSKGTDPGVAKMTSPDLSKYVAPKGSGPTMANSPGGAFVSGPTIPGGVPTRGANAINQAGSAIGGAVDRLKGLASSGFTGKAPEPNYAQLSGL